MKFTIDRAKWRSGRMGPHHTGRGSTRLLNKEGHMCCLGQVAEQLGVPPESLKHTSTPGGILDLPTCLQPILLDSDGGHTTLSANAMIVNDDDRPEITRAIREQLLTELFQEHGHDLEFVGEYSEGSSGG